VCITENVIAIASPSHSGRGRRFALLEPVVIRPEDCATHTVAIEYLFEQMMRRLPDRQVWRWDEEAKTWWLHRGLPEF